MGEWKECNLRDLVDKVIDNRGKNPPYSADGYEVIETGCISGKNKYPDYSLVRKYVHEDTYVDWFRSGHPQKNDLLIITVGNGIGSVSIMGDDRGVLTQNLIGLRFSQSGDSNFYYYFLNQGLLQDFLKSMNIGSAQPSLKVPHLLGIEVPYPPLPEQKAIASVLSSLDDKIDLLHRQNKTLEAMAETLFRQWFVPARPDEPHAGGKEAREDWEEGCLGDVIELVYGKGLKREIRTGTGYPVIGSSGVVGYHSEFLVEGPGIVIGRKGTLGKVIYLWDNFFPIDTTYYIKSKVESTGLLYEYFLLKTLNFEAMNSDSAVPG